MKTVFFALAALTFSSMSFAQDFYCSGTEPFWHVKVSKDVLAYSVPGEKTVKLKVESTQSAANVPAMTAFVVKAQDARVTAIYGSCNDGMSEKEFSHHAVLEMGGVVLYGCCQIAE